MHGGAKLSVSVGLDTQYFVYVEFVSNVDTCLSQSQSFLLFAPIFIFSTFPTFVLSFWYTGQAVL